MEFFFFYSRLFFPVVFSQAKTVRCHVCRGSPGHFGFHASPSSFKNVQSICVAVMAADKVNVTDKRQTLNARVPNNNLKRVQQHTSNFIHLTCKIGFPVSAFSGRGAVIVRHQHLALKSCVLLYILRSIFHNLDNNVYHIWLFIFAAQFSSVVLI